MEKPGRSQLGELFLSTWHERLGWHGYSADPGRIERVPGGIVVYHYTRPEHLAAIAHSGLVARRPVVNGERSVDLRGRYQIDALLEPLPRWLAESPSFGDLGLQMLRVMVGDLLVRIELPVGFPGLYVADFAHPLECLHHERRGRAPLGLGYDCGTGHDSMLAYLHSYVPLPEYDGGHLAPVVHVLRSGPGVVIPGPAIHVADQQPLRAGNWSECP
ncbi:MAG: hypothetical protein M3069_00700 [Chloroflexota bacterium]|nr:hypothetical protein [Chloroflexota bacterium]